MEVELNNEAVKQYRRLNEPNLTRITEAIEKLQREPPLEVRQEIHNLIDHIPEHKLYALRPILDELVSEEDANDDVLSDEEYRLLEKCRKDRKEHPESFTPWSKVRKG